MNVRKKNLSKFCLNFVYALYNCAIGMIMHSWWFVSSGVYHIICAVMRATMAAFAKNNRKNEEFAVKFSGAMMFLLSIVLCGTVYLTVHQNMATKYHEIVMITIALYAFVKLTLTLCGFIKMKRKKKTLIKVHSCINMADAVVSIYSLQRSMLVSFGEMSERDISLFNTLSGIGMCIIIMTCGIYLLKGEKMADSKIVKGVEKISKGVCDGYKK